MMPARAVPAYRRLREVPVHLVDQQVALRFFELVEHHDSLLASSVVLQKVEEPLEQIGVVLSQAAPRCGMGIGFDDAGERAAVEPCAGVEDRGDIVELRQGQGLRHEGIGPRAPSSRAVWASVGTSAGSSSTFRPRWRKTFLLSRTEPLELAVSVRYSGGPNEPISASWSRPMTSRNARSWIATPASTS